MRFQLDRSTIVLIIFVLLIGGIFGINQFVISQPPLEINIVVDPLAEDWLMAAAQEYNSQNVIINNSSRVQVTIQVRDDRDIWRGNPSWNSQNHPDAWIASSSLSLDYTPSSLPFEIVNESLAYTPLVWGGFQNRVDMITENGVQAFDWNSVQSTTAGTSWSDGGFVNMAINWPTGSTAGLGALVTAIASYQEDVSINRAVLSDSSFTTWFQSIEDSVRNSERFGGNPAQVMATRGTSAADFALLPESQWLTQMSSLLERGDISFAYPVYQFPLDFPVAIWSDSSTSDSTRSAVESFANFLSTEGASIALDYGFRPVNSLLDENASLFANAINEGILFELPASETVIVSDRSLVDAIILLVD